MTELITRFFEWAWGLILQAYQLFQWIITPLPILSELIGFDVAPIYLIGGGAVLTGALVLTVGIIRAIA